MSLRMFNLKTFLGCSSLLICSLVESANNGFPYEQCTWRDQAQTRELTNNFANYSLGDPIVENDNCDTVINDIIGSHITDQISAIAASNQLDKGYSPLCFLASNWRGDRLWGPQEGGKAYYHCPRGKKQLHVRAVNNKGKIKNIYTRSFCHNRNYVQTISKAFNEVSQCFDLSPEQKKYIFALFNHESSFHLNKRSNTGARCLGQMTMAAIKDVNRDINNKDTVSQKLFKRCPKLVEKVVPQEILKKELSWKKIKRITNKNRKKLDCALTHNPYSCLFYSIYFVKHYERIFNKMMEGDSEDHWSADFEIPQDIEERYEFPIQMGEILHVVGTCKTVKGSWLFQRNDKAYNFFKKCGFDKRLNARKVEIFEGFNDMIKWDVLLTSYNGGSSILMTYFPHFMRTVKKNIVKACKNPTRCPYRKSIELGRPLLSKNFFDKFQKYLLENYNAGSKRKNEVANFALKVSQDLEATVATGPSNKRNLASHLRKAFGNKATSAKIAKFIEKLQKHCPNQLRTDGSIYE